MSKIEEALKKSRMSRGREITNYHMKKTLASSTNLSLMTNVTPIDDEVLSRYKIIYPHMNDQKILNEFRSIRTALVKQLKGNNACILVFSTMPGGGASYTAMNIAASIALDAEKTALLVNCDFNNKPDYENLLDNNDTGLCDYLSGEATVEQIIKPVGIDRLRIIPSSSTGRAFSEYFSSSKFNYLIEEIATRYQDRYIILDAPSSRDEANVKLLEEFADYVILVVPSGINNVNQINKAKSLIGHEKKVGVVINDIPRIFQ
jgi:protein-tyrosine kinase